jgi:hypothetical protein
MRSVLERALAGRAARRREAIAAALREEGVAASVEGEAVVASGRGLRARWARELALREAGRGA